MKRIKPAIRDWNPKLLPGGVYCSPACGGKCKKVDFDRITIRVNELASRMGEGWTVVVWENLGWYGKITKGSFEIYYHDIHEYSAWFNSRIKNFQVFARARTPEKAMECVLDDVQDAIKILGIELKELLQ